MAHDSAPLQPTRAWVGIRVGNFLASEMSRSVNVLVDQIWSAPGTIFINEINRMFFGGWRRVHENFDGDALGTQNRRLGQSQALTHTPSPESSLDQH